MAKYINIYPDQKCGYKFGLPRNGLLRSNFQSNIIKISMLSKRNSIKLFETSKTIDIGRRPETRNISLSTGLIIQKGNISAINSYIR